MTVASEEVLETFDMAVRGEGEEAFLEVVERLDAGKSIRDVKNVRVRQDGVVYQNDLRPQIESIDDLPFPDWNLFDMQHYTNHFVKAWRPARDAKVAGAFEGSRGRIFTCTYCRNPTLMAMYGGPSWRREKSANRMADRFGANIFCPLRRTKMLLPIHIKGHAGRERRVQSGILEFDFAGSSYSITGILVERHQ